MTTDLPDEIEIPADGTWQITMSSDPQADGWIVRLSRRRVPVEVGQWRRSPEWSNPVRVVLLDHGPTVMAPRVALAAWDDGGTAEPFARLLSVVESWPPCDPDTRWEQSDG